VWIPVAFWCAVIFTLSSISKLPAPPGGMSDKDAHFLTYGMLGALLVNALAGARWRAVTGRVALTAIVLATAYGATDELHQLFVPGRECDIHDLMADALGASVAAVGLLLACAIIRRVRARVPAAL
jgi:VanZ family protein